MLINCSDSENRLEAGLHLFFVPSFVRMLESKNYELSRKSFRNPAGLWILTNRLIFVLSAAGRVLPKIIT